MVEIIILGLCVLASLWCAWEIWYAPHVTVPCNRCGKSACSFCDKPRRGFSVWSCIRTEDGQLYEVCPVCILEREVRREDGGLTLLTHRFDRIDGSR